MPKVLVVDDSLSVRKVVQRALESKRIEVLSAASGTEAIEQIAREAPDLVVCDVIMPDMDGYQICDFVKKHPALGSTPVLLISGIVNSTVLERAAKVRSDDVMRKPFAADELLHRIEGFLPAQARAAVPSPSPAAVPVLAPPALTPVAAEPAAAPMATASVTAEPGLATSLPALVVEPLPDIKPLLSAVAELPGVSLTALIDREGALIEAFKAGVPGNGQPFPEGAKIAKLQWKPKKSTEAPFDVDVPDVFTQAFLMEKDSRRFPATGGWGYALFDYDAPADSFTADPTGVADCGQACHVAVKAKDYIFHPYQKR